MGRYDTLLEKPQKEPEKQEPTKPEKKVSPHPTSYITWSRNTNGGKPQTHINQLVNQSINQPMHQLTNHLDDRMMSKPKGFYISEKLDKRLDRAVEYFEEQHHLKIDRSILLNALLEDEKLSDEQSLDRLINWLINQLTRKLTSR